MSTTTTTSTTPIPPPGSATLTLLGRIDWGLQRDKDGHRTYKVKWLVETSEVLDGPQRIFNCPGLPAIGAAWQFGWDWDAWAFCSPEMSVAPANNTPDPQRFWHVEQTFSTRPLKRCQDESITNPLLEPMGISGSFSKYQREVQKDRHGKVIQTSAWELIRGVEKDESRPTVNISMNTAENMVPQFGPVMDHVNDAELWGMPKRCVKLSGGTWTRKLWGLCNFYFTTELQFDLKYDTFDRKIHDYGTYALRRDLLYNADGTPKTLTNEQKDNLRKDLTNIVQYKDTDFENGKRFLDLHGAPWEPTALDAIPPHFETELYEETNFLLLGIPSSLG